MELSQLIGNESLKRQLNLETGRRGLSHAYILCGPAGSGKRTLAGLLAAALVLTFVLRAGDGKLGGVRVMPAGTSYVVTWITCGVIALTMALTLMLGASAGLYLLFALVGWVFIQAVFFTVKLM